MRQRVLVVFETDWDRPQLEACRAAWGERIELVFADPTDLSCPWDFDVLGFVERVVDGAYGRLDGVLSSSDYPGATVAAAIATRLGLPGARPECVIRASHKFASRRAQREAVPEAVPPFALVDPQRAGRDPLPLPFPCFVKPVKGAFSVLARRVDSQRELDAFLRSPAVLTFTREFMAIFDQLVGAFAPAEATGRHFIAEGLVGGQLVTVEGFACDGDVEILGIVDSVVDPATKSFLRFDYPSALPERVQARMAELARRTVRRLGLERTPFNIEMSYQTATDQVFLIEVNPRLCGQFADLYRKVDGTSGYEVALALATGGHPRLRRGAGRHAAAASVPLRVFEPVRVARAPGPADRAAAEALFPDARVWVECEAGELLADFDVDEDGRSHRYAVINLAGADRDEITRRQASVTARLGFSFDPLVPRAAVPGR